jgi:hypothetical protein
VSGSFFSLELCFPVSEARACHDELRAVLAKGLDQTTPRGKWLLWKSSMDVMQRYLPQAVLGCWEYFDDASADRMYEDWLEPMTNPQRRPQATSDDTRYFTFTLMMQVQSSSTTDYVLKTACSASEPNLWTRATFAKILDAVRKISFGVVVRDCVYMMPRDIDGYGFTHADLRGEKMTYLRPIT